MLGQIATLIFTTIVLFGSSLIVNTYFGPQIAILWVIAFSTACLASQFTFLSEVINRKNS